MRAAISSREAKRRGVSSRRALPSWDPRDERGDPLDDAGGDLVEPRVAVVDPRRPTEVGCHIRASRSAEAECCGS
jgi:hypothetical protein